MKLVKRLSIEDVMGIVASIALLIGISSMSQACFLTFNQPKVPQGMEKYRVNKQFKYVNVVLNTKNSLN